MGQVEQRSRCEWSLYACKQCSLFTSCVNQLPQVLGWTLDQSCIDRHDVHGLIKRKVGATCVTLVPGVPLPVIAESQLGLSDMFTSRGCADWQQGRYLEWYDFNIVKYGVESRFVQTVSVRSHLFTPESVANFIQGPGSTTRGT